MSSLLLNVLQACRLINKQRNEPYGEGHGIILLPFKTSKTRAT